MTMITSGCASKRSNVKGCRYICLRVFEIMVGNRGGLIQCMDAETTVLSSSSDM